MEHRLSTVSQFVRCIHPSGADSGEDPQVAGVESSQSLNLQSAAAAMHPLSPFAQELDVLNTNADTRTESASCKVDTSEVPQLFRALSGISTGIGAGALTAMREIAARSTTTANTVSRAFNGAAVAMKYRPSQDTRSKAGVEAAVEDFFSFMDRSGQQLVEDLALPVGSLATHMQVLFVNFFLTLLRSSKC